MTHDDSCPTTVKLKLCISHSSPQIVMKMDSNKDSNHVEINSSILSSLNDRKNTENDCCLQQPKTTPLVFDDIIIKLGSFGKYQVGVYIWTALLEIPAALCVMFLVLGGANPGWDCVFVATDQLANNTSGVLDQTSLPPSPYHNQTITRHSSLVPYNRESNGILNESNPHLQWVIPNVCQSNVSQKCERHEYHGNFTSYITEWDLICDKSYIPTIITSMLMVGLFVGAYLFGYISDHYGRRHVLYAASLMMMVSHFMMAFSTSWILMAVFRFLVGIFSAGILLIQFIVPMEIVGKQWRMIGTLGGFPFGTMLLALLGYFIQDWRHLCMTSGLISLPLMIGWLFIYESPRWLLQRNRIEEAEKVMKRIAQINKKQEVDITDLKTVVKSYKEDEEEKRKYSYLDLFSHRELTKRTLVIMYLWFSCSLLFYGIAINIRDLSGNRYFNLFLIGVIEFPMNLSVIFFAKWFGRKKPTLVFLSAASLFMIIILIFDLYIKEEQYMTYKTIIAIFGKAFISAAWILGQIICAELFPTVIRAMGCGAATMVSRIAGVLAPQTAYLHHFHPVIPYMIYGFFAVTSSILCITLLPETKDVPLPDSIPPRDHTFSCSCFNRKDKHQQDRKCDNVVDMIVMSKKV